ncbi:hypothetical protein [Streptomyces sp. NPDC057910]|uniref:hypothetical protein n=1 Tax=Streptomyces sp. NPDC057910 TaxID=3346278 RepID=UPI0036E575E7
MQAVRHAVRERSTGKRYAVANHEAHWQHASDGYFELDGLKVPATHGVRLMPLTDGVTDVVVAVTAVLGPTAIQLQVFHLSVASSERCKRLDEGFRGVDVTRPW